MKTTAMSSAQPIATGAALLWLVLLAASPLLGEAGEDGQPEAAYQSPEIVVTATRTRQALEDVPLTTTVILRESIEALPVRDMDELLTLVTGTQIRTTIPGGLGTVGVRGSQSAQVLVTLDGMPLNDLFNGLTDLSMLPLDRVERIEIVHGPASHLYGANALGGVINIITRKPTAATEFGVAQGSFNTRDVSLNVGRAGNRHGLGLAATLNRSDGWRGNDDYRRRHLLGTYTATLEPLSAALQVGYDDGEVGVPGMRPAGAATFGDDEVTSLFDRQHTEIIHGLATLGAVLGSGYQLDLKLRPERKTLTFDTRYLDWFSGDTILNDNAYVAENLRLSGQVEKTLNSHRFVAGFDMIGERGSVAQTTTNQATGDQSEVTWEPATRTAGLWAEYIFHGDHLVAVPGIRIDEHSSYGRHISPNLGLTLHFGPQTIRLSAGTAFRAPTYNDLFWPGAGNQDLKVERGTAVEMALERHFIEGLRASLAVFRRHSKDMIAWAPMGENGVWLPFNINRHVAAGFEARSTVLSGPWKVHLGYSYLHGEQTNREVVYSDWMTGEVHTESVKRTAAYTPRHSATLDAIYQGRRFLGTLAAAYQGRRVSYYPDYATAAPEVTMAEKRLPGRLVVNAKIGWRRSRLMPYLVVRNLLNTSYAGQFGNSIEDGNYPMPGRTLAFGLEGKF